MAGGLSLSTLWLPGKFTGQNDAAEVPGLSVPSLGNGRDNFSGHPHSSPRVVSSNVVGHHPEERGQRAGAATSLGSEPV